MIWDSTVITFVDKVPGKGRKAEAMYPRPFSQNAGYTGSSRVSHMCTLLAVYLWIGGCTVQGTYLCHSCIPKAHSPWCWTADNTHIYWRSKIYNFTDRFTYLRQNTETIPRPQVPRTVQAHRGEWKAEWQQTGPSLSQIWVLAWQAMYVWAPGHKSSFHCIVGDLAFQKAA